MSYNEDAKACPMDSAANEAMSAGAVTDETAIEPSAPDATAGVGATDNSTLVDDNTGEEIPEVRILSEEEYEALSEEERSDYVLSIAKRVLIKYRKAFEELAK
jgi:hypothetical protein